MLKNLATCNPKEFLVQTNRIRKLAKGWLDVTKIFDIAKVDKSTIEGKTEAEAKKAQAQVIIDRLDKALEKMLDADADKTLQLMCYCCFVPPEKCEEVQMWEMIESFNDMLENEAVIHFFMSLTTLIPRNTSD